MTSNYDFVTYSHPPPPPSPDSIMTPSLFVALTVVGIVYSIIKLGH